MGGFDGGWETEDGVLEGWYNAPWWWHVSSRRLVLLEEGWVGWNEYHVVSLVCDIAAFLCADYLIGAELQ